jgi:hypothetical protein
MKLCAFATNVLLRHSLTLLPLMGSFATNRSCRRAMRRASARHVRLLFVTVGNRDRLV